MRELREWDVSKSTSLEVFSVLQLWNIDEPLLPNLKTLTLWHLYTSFFPFIPLFLSPTVTSILLGFGFEIPKAMVASAVAIIPTLCPKLQTINLQNLWRDPMITAAVSGVVLATNRNTLQEFRVNSPLTKEASEVVFKLSSLRSLSLVIKGETSLPPASFPNLTALEIDGDNEGSWPGLFHGATFGKLESVVFYPQSKEIGDFLGAFEKAALSSSVQNTLSTFQVFDEYSWNPNYSSLLSFTQLVDLHIGFSCDGGCSSTVDDNVVISLSRAMPRLNILQLGYPSCRELATGITTKGFMALALHCPNLSSLCVHFQVDSFVSPPAGPGITPDAEPTTSWTDCALTELSVGEVPVPEESVLMVTLTLLRIFPRIETINSDDGGGWEEVEGAICLSKRVVDCSSKQFSLTTR